MIILALNAPEKSLILLIYRFLWVSLRGTKLNNYTNMKKGILLLSIVVLASCSKTEDLFDKEHVKEEAKENFPVQNIDPNHNWDMADVGTLTVSINQKSGEVYTVKVYTDNPLTSGSTAKLMAKKDGVKDGEPVTFKFDMPSGLQYVYVMKENTTHNRSIRMVDMSDANPNVSWENDGSRSASVIARATNPYYEKPDESIFPPALPARTYEYNPNSGMNGNIRVTKDETIVTLLEWGDYSIYITAADVRLKGTLNMGSQIYLLDGASVTFDSNLTLGSGSLVSVAAGAKIVSPYSIDGSRENVKIYNGGDISVSGISFVRGGYLYNEGTVEVKNSISMVDDNVALINLGSLTSGAIITSGTNPLIYNACNMTVSKTMSFSGSGTTLAMDGDTYLKCGTLNIARTKINLASKAMLVCNKVTVGVGNVIAGVGDEKSLLYVIGTVENTDHSLCVTYSGNLLVACDEDKHFGHNVGETNYLLKGEADMKPKAEVKIPEGAFEGCSPGYTIVDREESGKEDTPQVYTFAFEDMTTEAGDYDFNDVVIKVETVPVNGKLKVRLVAAGATKKLKVYYKGRVLFNDKEIHEAFGFEAGSMINTGITSSAIIPEDEIDATTLATDGNFYIMDVDHGLYVYLPKFDESFEKGDPPYALMIPTDWSYPSERVPITNIYGDAFREWAKDATKNITWYLSNN